MELVLGLGMRWVGFSLFGVKGPSRRLETVLRASRYAGLTLAGMTPCATWAMVASLPRRIQPRLERPAPQQQPLERHPIARTHKR